MKEEQGSTNTESPTTQESIPFWARREYGGAMMQGVGLGLLFAIVAAHLPSEPLTRFVPIFIGLGIGLLIGGWLTAKSGDRQHKDAVR